MNPLVALAIGITALAAATFVVVAIGAWLQNRENSGP